MCTSTNTMDFRIQKDLYESRVKFKLSVRILFLMEWHTEQEMRDIWLQNNGNNTEGMPDFEYYEFENHLLYNYYVYMTIFSQGK